MNHPLQQKVRTVARRSKRLLVLRAVAAVVVTVLIASLAMALVDYAFRLQDNSVRIVCTAGVVAAFAWSAFRFLLPALRYRWRDVDVARRAELRFPQLGDRLSSAIAFLQQAERDSTAGSAALRRAVIAQATDEVGRLDLSEVTYARHALTMTAAVGTALLLIGAAFVADPTSASLASQRLVTPWRSVRWPRRNDLAFEGLPRRIAEGTDLELVLIDRNGRLPANVTLYVRSDEGGETAGGPVEMRFRGGKMTYRLTDVTRPLRLRAVGGDDNRMPWHTIDVVEPPRVDSFQLKLVPPEYTRWPATAVQNDFRALEGTRVKVTGAATKRLASAALTWTDEDGHTDLPARLGSDGQTFFVPGGDDQSWVINESGTYWFELVDQQGLRGGTQQRWAMQSIVDHAPTISLERPRADTTVTAAAMLSLRGLIKDDLGVHTVQLRYSRSDRTDDEEAVDELFRGPDEMPSFEESGLAGRSESGDSYQLDQMWDLASVEGLAPGTVLSFYLAASDYKPQENRSAVLRLTIASPNDLEDRIGRRQSYVLSKLADILKLQRNVQSQSAAVEIELAETERLAQPGIDQLHSAELNQRDVRRRLVGDEDSIQRQIDDLLEELEVNRFGGSEMQRRMSELSRVITGLGRDFLPAIEHELIGARKAAQRTWDSEDGATIESQVRQNPLRSSLSAGLREADKSATDSLARALDHQGVVIITLERLLGELAQWDGYRQFARDVSQLARDQEDVARETDRLRFEILTTQVQDRTPAQLAELKQVSARQLDLARQLGTVTVRMEKMRSQSEQSDARTTETIADALAIEQRLAISGQMRQSSQEIQHHRMGQAVQMQQQIAEGLQQVLGALTHQPASPMNLLVRLKNVLTEIIAGQQSVVDETARLDQVRRRSGNLNPNDRDSVAKLAGAQRQLAVRTDSLLGETGHLRVLHLALQPTTPLMHDVVRRLARNEIGEETQRVERDVLRRLRQLGEALDPDASATRPDDRTIQTTEGQTDPPASDWDARQRLAELKLLKLLQIEVHQRTVALDTLRTHGGGLSRNNQQELTLLALQQQQLTEMVARLMEPVESGKGDMADETIGRREPSEADKSFDNPQDRIFFPD